MLYLQLLSALASPMIVIVGFLYSNSLLSDFGSRIGDMRVDMRGSMGDIRGSMNDMRDMLRAEITVLQVIMEKNHSEALGKFAELESRVSRLEEKVH